MMNLMPLGLVPETQAAIEPRRRPATLLDPVEDFGAVGDGVTDTSDALMAMRQHMADRWDQHFEVCFPYGHYVYDTNLWVSGVGSITIDGNGSKFECLNTVHAANTRPFWARPFFDEADPAAPLSFSKSTGGRITGCPQAPFERAVAGSTVLTLKPAILDQPYLAVTDLAAGDRIFIWAFDNQFSGYPPNLRYFEWNEVASVDTGAGTVTLKFPLQFDYEENLRDAETWDDVWYGKARLFKLDRPSGQRYPRYIELKNIIIEPNRNVVDPASGIRLPAEHFILDNVKSPSGYLWLGFNRIAEVKHCEFGHTDLDKLVGTAIITDTTFHEGVSPASGFLNLIVERCRIKGRISVCARNNYLRNNLIFPFGLEQAIIMNTVNSIKKLEVSGNTIVPDALTNKVIDTRHLSDIDFVPDSVSGREIIIDDTEDNRRHIRNIDVGSSLLAGDTAGKITRIWYDNDNSNWHIETDFGQLSVGQTYRYVVGQELIFSNNEVLGKTILPFDHFELAFKKGPIDLIVPTNLMSRTFALEGFVSKLEAWVVRPQKNVSAEFPDPLFRVHVFDATGSEVARIQLDPTQVGISSTGLAGDIGSVLTPLPTNQFVLEVELIAWGKTGSNWERGWTGDGADKPIIQLRIEGRSIL